MRLVFFSAALIALTRTASPAPAPFLCATGLDLTKSAKATTAAQLQPPPRAAALVLFAHFAGASESGTPPPAWTQTLFDPQLPGSIAHFYKTMSQGRHLIHGATAPNRYGGGPAAAYLAADAVTKGDFGRFSLEILQQADLDIDFSRFDDDGPDGVPNSGDDDGAVDALFLVLPRVPANFLRGPATGISSLGLDAPFSTDDRAADGGFIRIESSRGTLQKGHNASTAIGTICHEYGHLLGLPDLFNTLFLAQSDAPPADDSAGIGRWGLMGWGALGWQGDDGPASFSAWSRLQLGWAQVEELAETETELALADVGRNGDLYRIPMGLHEYFLLEYRTRNSTFYDRQIPAPGLLVWHVGRGISRSVVDLECADGRWDDAGFPAGTRADPIDGGDNLDFWAHDQAYTQTFSGNLGDATDPFGTPGADRFTPLTNPSATSSDQRLGLHLEAIHLDPDSARATIRVEPPQLEIIQVRVIDDSGDGLLAPGEGGLVRFRLVNLGGAAARDITVELTTDEPHLEIAQALSHFEQLKMTHQSGAPQNGFPRLQAGQFEETRSSLRATLTVRAPGTSPIEHSFTLAAATTVPVRGRLLDPQGQGLADFEVLANGQGRSYPMTTAADGSFAQDLPPGSYLFQVNPPPSSGLAVSLNFIQVTGDMETQVEIILETTTTISGTVHDEAGQPLERVTVEGPVFSQGTTDASGRFSLDIPVTTASVRIVPSLDQQQSGLVPLRVRLDPLDPAPLTIVLPHGVFQEVELVDPQGNPLRSRRVDFNGTRVANDAVTDNDGRAALALLPDIYSFNLFQFFNPGLFSSYNARAIELDLETPLRFVVPDLFLVQGRVEDISPEPFFLGQIRFTSVDGHYSSQVDLPAEGTYQTILPQGRYLVTYEAQQSGLSPSQRLDTVLVEGEAQLNFQVDAPPPIRGRITGPLPANLTLRAVSERIGLSATASVEADGSFALPLQPDRYLFLAAGPEGQGFWHLGWAQIPAEEALSLAFPQGANMRGQVVQEVPPNRPNSVLLMLVDDPLDLFARVMLSNRSPSVLSTTAAAGTLVDADNRYTLSAQPGDYDLVVLPWAGNGIGHAFTGLHLEGSTNQDLFLPAHPRTHRLYGTLSGPAQALQGEWTLRLYDQDSGVVVQENEFFLASSGIGYLRERDFNIAVPPGTYRARIGLSDPVLGIYRQHDLGAVQITGDRRWDIALTPANTAIDEKAGALPATLQLGQNYPNPFNSGTAIPFVLPRPDSAELTVYNLLGQQVARLTTGPLQAGPQTLHWDGRGQGTQPLATGLYIYRLQAGQQALTRKLLLLR
ncbi:MAG: T9SS type A sorting domain-containing protein [Candidatus Latescibacteria bacterium]|nr:T9SS type A sorting domain-containing protein [Candidatus Latescibacterota bacterium]